MNILAVITECSSPVLATFLGITKRVLTIIQILAPIVLIISLSINITKMVTAPDNKKIPKKILNSVIATAIIFFIPVFINILMSVLGETTSFSDCWNNVEIKGIFQATYIDVNEKQKKQILSDPNNYENGDPVEVSNNGTSETNFNRKLSNMSTPSKAEIARVASSIGISEDYVKIIIGTTYNEGVVNDPYLYYGWASAMINTQPSLSVIYGWGGGTDFYSQANINKGYMNATPNVLKAVYLALTERNTKIVECNGMYKTTPAGYKMIYQSSVYNAAIYEKR